MATRAPKRRKLAAANDIDPAFPTAQLQLLIGHLLSTLERTDVDASSLVRVRRAPPSVGIGVYVSDVAVRLFHAHGVQSTLLGSSDGPQLGTRQVFPSGTALAAFCVDLMEKKRQDEPQTYHRITRIAVPDDDAYAAGVHGDRVLVYTRQFATVRKLDTPLEDRISVLFHDDAILIVDKPHGTLSVEGNSPEEDGMSVQRLVQEYYPDARMVHRLDQETSGILVVALTRSAAQHLNQQFRDRTVHKTYVARVVGHVQGESGIINVRMAPSKTERLIQQVVAQDGEDGAISCTEWRVLERSEDNEDLSTLMELKPVTGKTHQLRVHMQHMGHPILGDSLYSPERVRALAPRLLLHAAAIDFEHPATHERLTITCTRDF